MKTLGERAEGSQDPSWFDQLGPLDSAATREIIYNLKEGLILSMPDGESLLVEVYRAERDEAEVIHEYVDIWFLLKRASNDEYVKKKVGVYAEALGVVGRDLELRGDMHLSFTFTDQMSLEANIEDFKEFVTSWYLDSDNLPSRKRL